MWVFWVSALLLLIIFVLTSVGVYRKFFNDGLNDYFEWVVDKKYYHFAYAAALIIFLFYMTIGQLWLTSKCWYDQHAYNVTTEYNWFKGQCLYTGRNGAKLPLWNTRDVADGQDHSEPTLDTPPVN